MHLQEPNTGLPSVLSLRFICVKKGDESQDYDYVTLETDITFDTEQPSGSVSQPNVIRRHIENEVQVVDGETVVLGGLRSKVSKDCRESLPFIGELPGIGKFF